MGLKAAVLSTRLALPPAYTTRTLARVTILLGRSASRKGTDACLTSVMGMEVPGSRSGFPSRLVFASLGVAWPCLHCSRGFSLTLPYWKARSKDPPLLPFGFSLTFPYREAPSKDPLPPCTPSHCALYLHRTCAAHFKKVLTFNEDPVLL